MKRMGIEVIYRRPKTSKPAANHKIYSYLLRGFSIDKPNQVWATDITYIPMKTGYVYLVAVIDWYARKVLSWKLSITLEIAFCVSAVKEAIAKYGRPEIFNTPLKHCFTMLCRSMGLTALVQSELLNFEVATVWLTVYFGIITLKEYHYVSAILSTLSSRIRKNEKIKLKCVN